jgi:hypothetical protein
MRRGIRIAISLIAVVLLFRLPDCFLNGPSNPEAMDCCLKGKCAPTAKSDDCCKNNVPGGSLLIASESANHVALVLFAAIPASIPQTDSNPSFYVSNGWFHHPPPLPDVTTASLPLLI